jgi:Cytochrome b5-like Heme/Steroid binding domain
VSLFPIEETMGLRGWPPQRARLPAAAACLFCVWFVLAGDWSSSPSLGKVDGIDVWRWEDVDSHVELGAQLVVLFGDVVNLTSFLSNHPGGALVLEQRFGQDITLDFRHRAHRHTRTAREIAREYRVAQLEEREINLRVYG